MIAGFRFRRNTAGQGGHAVAPWTPPLLAGLGFGSWVWRAVLTVSAAVGLLAQTPEDAEAVLRRAAERYRGADAYFFIANEETVTESGPQRKEAATTVLTARDAEGRTRVELDDGRNGGVAVDDGSSKFVYVPRMEKYVELPQQEAQQPDQGVPGIDFSRLVKRFVDRYASLDERVLQAELTGTETLTTQQGDVECDVVAAVYNPPPGMREGDIERTYWISREDGVVLKEHSVAGMTPVNSPQRVTVTQDIRFQSAQIGGELDPDTFLFVPPPGTLQVESFRQDAPDAGAVDAQAPDFTLETIDSARPVQLSSLRGKVVLLDFWATWCGPCRYDMPFVQELYDEYNEKGLEVYGLNSEVHTRAINYLAKNSLTFPTLHDAGMRVAMLFQVKALPSFIVVDRQGRIANYMIGTRSKAELEKALFDAGL